VIRLALQKEAEVLALAKVEGEPELLVKEPAARKAEGREVVNL